MYPSKLSDDDLYDEYLEPTAYGNSSNVTSFDAHSPFFSSYEPLHYYPHPPQTSAHETSHTFTSTDLDAVGSETSEVYLSDHIGVETELHAMFGNSCQDQRTGYTILDPAELDREFYSFLRAESPGDVWYDREPCTKSARQCGDFATTQTTAHDQAIQPST
jgi:hypothetical protein